MFLYQFHILNDIINALSLKKNQLKGCVIKMIYKNQWYYQTEVGANHNLHHPGQNLDSFLHHIQDH